MVSENKWTLTDAETDSCRFAINELVEEAWHNAEDHGFHNDLHTLKTAEIKTLDSELCVPSELVSERVFTLAALAKIASEAGEAVHAIQHGDHEAFREELADIVIRCFDLAGEMENADDLDFGEEIIRKMQHNRTRPYLHGKCC